MLVRNAGLKHISHVQCITIEWTHCSINIDMEQTYVPWSMKICTYVHSSIWQLNSNCTPNKVVSAAPPIHLSSPAYPPQQPTYPPQQPHPSTSTAPPIHLSSPPIHLSSPPIHLSSPAHPSQQPHPPTSDVEAMSCTFLPALRVSTARLCMREWLI